MKSIKKLLAALLAVVMVAAICGCGGDGKEEKPEKKSNGKAGQSQTETDSEYITDTESFKAAVGELVDLSKYSITDDKADMVSYAIKSEAKEDYKLDFKVEIGDGTEFTLPVKLPDLAAKGWNLTENSKPEEEFEPEYGTSGTIENSKGERLRIEAYNPGPQTVAFKECTVDSVDFVIYSIIDFKKNEDLPDFTVFGNITKDSTIEDVIKTLGNPKSIIIFCGDGETYPKIVIDYEEPGNAFNKVEFTFLGEKNVLAEVKCDVD